MGAPYQSQSASNYNSSPPPDDGSTTAANKIAWTTIKSKITDPLKTLADAVNTALRAALNVTPSSTSTAYTTLVGDHQTTIEVTSGASIHLGDAVTMIAQAMGYTVTVQNKSTSSNSTVDLATNTNTLAGQVNGTVTLPPGSAMTFTVAQSGAGYDIVGASGFAPFVLTGTAGTVNAITAAAPANLVGLYSGLIVVLTPTGANTGGTTLTITPSGGSAFASKNIFWKGAALVGREFSTTPKLLHYDGTQFNILDGSEQTLAVIRGFIDGLTLSTAGSSTTMTTAAGQAADSTNAVMMTLASATGKTTSAWAVGSGNGGLDTGAIANSTWYHFYEIMRPDTGVVDVLFSLSASAPTMPTNYTYKRRIGSGKTDGSGNWTAFVQDGDNFEWLSPPALDVSATNPGTTAVTRTLTVPTGVNVTAQMNAQLAVGATAGVLYLTDLAINDDAASFSSTPLAQIFTNTANAIIGAPVAIRTNTSAQIRSRVGSGSDGSTVVRIATTGWIDKRGKNS